MLHPSLIESLQVTVCSLAGCDSSRGVVLQQFFGTIMACQVAFYACFGVAAQPGLRRGWCSRGCSGKTEQVFLDMPSATARNSGNSVDMWNRAWGLKYACGCRVRAMWSHHDSV
jgi:hypothetical protein